MGATAPEKVTNMISLLYKRVIAPSETIARTI
jgi:hypothetical protein